MFSVQQGPRNVDFAIKKEPAEGDVLVLAVKGELDVATVPGLRDELNGALERGVTRMVVDLSDVTFVDSVSLAALLTTSRRLGDAGRFALVVQRDSYGMLIFEAGGIDAVLPLFETRLEAVAHARS
jgi:anti-sigma B factor antagonist